MHKLGVPALLHAHHYGVDAHSEAPLNDENASVSSLLLTGS